MEIHENKRTKEIDIRLYDGDIRPVLFDTYEMGNARLRFFEEFCIGKSRADAVMISDEITGFEIKSDKDSLDRLEKQVKNYNRFCDKAYLVVGTKFLEKAEEEIPAFWGIYYVYADNEGTIRIEMIREAAQNPRIRIKTQMKLLWRNELINIVRKYKMGGVSTRNKRQLAELILEKLPKELARREMCEQLLERDYTIYDENGELIGK